MTKITSAAFLLPEVPVGINDGGTCNHVLVAFGHDKSNLVSERIIKQRKNALLHGVWCMWLKEGHANCLLDYGHMKLLPGSTATHLVQLPQLVISMP